MIQSFQCRETEQIFKREFSKLIHQQLLKRAYIKLKILNSATSLMDLSVPPGNRLEKLRGNRKEQHSIRINDQWRICFEWKNGHVYKVEIVDYH